LLGQSNAQEVVIRTLGHTEPGYRLVTERHIAVVNLFETLVSLAKLFVDLVRDFKSCIHHIAREWLEHRTASNKTTQCGWILGIVSRKHVLTCGARSGSYQ